MLDVIIIGGGVIGCAIARELSRFKLQVLLLEKTDDICNGQSKANTAIIHGGYDAKPGTQKARFNVAGNKMYESVCAELDVPRKWNTSLVVSFSFDDHDKLEELLRQGAVNGVPDLRI
ncbi:MAG: FAD-dependent oxidoreductase, partial [Pygmaiobacter massiliensis]